MSLNELMLLLNLSTWDYSTDPSKVWAHLECRVKSIEITLDNGETITANGQDV